MVRRDVAQAQVRNDTAAWLKTETLHHANHVAGTRLCGKRRHDCNSFKHPDQDRKGQRAAVDLDINQNHAEPGADQSFVQNEPYLSHCGQAFW